MSTETTEAPEPRVLDHAAGPTCYTINLTGALLIIAVVICHFSDLGFTKGVEWWCVGIGVVMMMIGNLGIRAIEKQIKGTALPLS